MAGPTKTRTDLNGARIIFPGQTAIYLVDCGYLRHVPDQATYERLFRDWNNLEKSIRPKVIPIGKPIASEAYLAKADGKPEVYLVETSVKRHVVDPQAMDKYYFDWNKIQIVPDTELQELVEGPPIS